MASLSSRSKAWSGQPRSILSSWMLSRITTLLVRTRPSNAIFVTCEVCGPACRKRLVMIDSARTIRVISGRQLRELVAMADAIDAVREAFIQMADAKIEQIPRTALPDGSLLTKVAAGH